jgi:predicted nucleic acid-binding protein
VPEVISNTSPLQYLFQIERLDLLKALYGSIIVPEGVVQELAVGRAKGYPLPEVESLPWIDIRKAPHEGFLPVAVDLGQGEREVLALAVEIPDALAILDDGLARHYARILGLEFTGTLGILLRAKDAGLLDLVGPAIRQLQELGFRLAGATRIAVLELAGED